MTDALVPLHFLRSLLLTGPDARGFLQGQLSSDLSEVSPARGQLSAWHDAKGRVLAFLRVLPRSDDGFALVMQADLVETVERRMRMFVLRAKVAIENGPPVYGLAHAPDGTGFVAGLAPGEGPLAAACDASTSVLRMPGSVGWLVVSTDPARVTATDAAAEARWSLAETAAGLPEVFPATQGEFVAQMLNLDRIGAVSFTKGCYPGQEIIARAHHLGRVKRRARPFRAPGPAPAPGDALADAAGTVVRAAGDADGCLLLAVVAEDAPGPFALADGRPLSPAG